MASRNSGGSGLDDLKNRLGIEEEEEPEELEEEASSEDEEGESSSSAAAPASSRATGATPSAEEEDYATAVYDDTEMKIDPSELEDFDEEELQSLPLKGLWIAGAIALAAGVFFGVVGSSVFSQNKIYSEKLSDSQQLFETVKPIQGNIVALNNSLQQITLDGYKPEFGAALDSLYKDKPAGAYILKPGDVSAAAATLAIDSKLSNQIINYTVNTKAVHKQVKEHMAAVKRNAEDLQAAAAGEVDEKNYAIVFDSETQGERWQKFSEDPETNAYKPIKGLKVTYEALEVETIDDKHVYTITLPSGDERQIPIYEVIPVDKEQLIEKNSAESPIVKYVRRARQLKEAIATLSQQGKSLLEALEKDVKK